MVPEDLGRVAISIVIWSKDSGALSPVGVRMVGEWSW